MRSKTWQLILASQSPRRLAILKNAGFVCTSFSPNSSESFDENLTIEENLKAIAGLKVQAVVSRLSNRKLKGKLILGADTVVVAGKQVLGKPENRRDALRMLKLLSGKTHSVKTSFRIYCPEMALGITRIVNTRVKFAKLSPGVIQWYLDSGEWFDKAGSYAIQGLARKFVVKIEGDLFNVVGLPLNAFTKELRKHRWKLRVQAKDKRRAGANSSGRT